MKPSTKLRSTVFIFSIVALLLSVCLYLYLSSQSSSLVDRVIDSQKKVLASNASKAQGKDILALFKETESDRAAVKNLIVPKDNAVTFIKTVESIGESSGAEVGISTIKSDNPSGDEGLKMGTVSATVSVSGSWAQVMRALELFEAFPYKSSINNIDLKLQEIRPAESKDKEIRIWKLTFDLSAATI